MSRQENNDNHIIGQRIREARIHKKMSQSDLAQAASISLPHISDIELGKTRMMLSTFIRITEALNVTPDYLLEPICKSDFSSLLHDCSPSETKAILSVLRDVKEALRTNK